MLRRRKGQSMLEYAMIIAVIVGALIAMQIFLRRSVQGKLRDSVDDIGGGGQYSAGDMYSKVTTCQIGNFVTTETFGVTDVGISNYVIDTAPTMNVYATGADSETIATSFNVENLLE